MGFTTKLPGNVCVCVGGGGGGEEAVKDNMAACQGKHTVSHK